MTVAAVVLSATPDGSVADAAGVPRVRRIADSAWSGGALPVVVVSGDADGIVAAALAGSEATLVPPAPPAGGPVGQIVHGCEAAAELVGDVSAALVWPARIAWVGPETVTSLIEAHGTNPGTVLVPAFRGEPGWPRLLPLAHLDALRGLGAERMPDDLFDDLVATDGVATRRLELGDPGTTHDASTAREDLPPYEGPSEPASGHVHEWGAAVPDEADTADSGPS